MYTGPESGTMEIQAGTKGACDVNTHKTPSANPQ
jgi:hypothetical protein